MACLALRLPNKACHDPFSSNMNKIMNAMLDSSVQELSVVAIVGYLRDEKTYLAKEIYTSAEVQKHFDVHIWLSGGSCLLLYLLTNKYMRELLSIEDDEADISNFLRGKRYCVVIDDHADGIYSVIERWSDVLRELPDNNNGSRVLVTRIPENGERSDRIPISNLQYVVRRSNEESLEMLRQAAFLKDPLEGCPADLQMKFVSKCEGLAWPLRFLGGLLSELPWKEVLGRIIDVLEARGERFTNFALKYRNLPCYQCRAVFLYFLTFTEDAEIHAKSLVPMLEAEGITFSFPYPTGNDVLEALSERSMIKVTKRYSDGSIKCCRLHDPLLRLLAIHEAKEKRFVRANDSFIIDLFDARDMLPSNMVKRNYKFSGKFMDVAQLADASCIFNFGENFPLGTPLMSNKVLEIYDSKVKVDAMREVKKRGELKYLGLNNLRLLPEILEINGSDQHLRTLVVRDTSIETLPSNELLKMISLKHLFLRNTKVREIPKLPETLKTLQVRDTPIETLPEWIGSSKLDYLLLRNTKINEIPKLPESLKTLSVRSTPIENLPKQIEGHNLLYLSLRNTKVSEIPKLPDSLNTLDVGETPIENLPEWTGSSKLDHLFLRNTKVREILKIPKRLKTLDVRNTPIETLPEWTENFGLRYLILRNTKVCMIPKLPKYLWTLDIGDTPIEIMGDSVWSSGCFDLFLRNTKIREIPKISERLKTLNVTDTPIETLPECIGSSNLTSLIFRNTNVLEIPKLPKSLKTLDIRGTPIEALPDASFYNNLTTVVLKNTKVREIPKSYTKLEYLDVRNTFVRSLPVSLWSNLRSVLATDTMQHLDGPPTSLKENNKKTHLGRQPQEDFTPQYDRLETLKTVHVTKDWAKSIPRFHFYVMKKLGLSYFQNDFTAGNALDWNIITRILGGLGNLSSLKIQGSDVPAEIIDVPTCPSYEKELKELSVGGSYSLFSLSGIEIPPMLIALALENFEFEEDPMPILGKLQHLKTLRLRWLLYSAQTRRMICTNGEFPQLERLHIYHISGLEEWSVEEGALPEITHVVIECCKKLKNLSGPLVDRTTPLKELHLHAMPPGFTTKFSHLPFVKITENYI